MISILHLEIRLHSCNGLKLQSFLFFEEFLIVGDVFETLQDISEI